MRKIYLKEERERELKPNFGKISLFGNKNRFQKYTLTDYRTKINRNRNVIILQF